MTSRPQAAEAGFRLADLGGFFRLAFRFWRAERRVLAWGLVAGLVVLTIAALGFQVALNQWNRAFFDAVERRDDGALAQAFTIFGLLMLYGIFVAVGFVLCRMLLQLRWREYVTVRLLRGWMTSGHAYQLDLVAPDLGNPEYRIASDVQKTTELFVEFVMGFLSAALMAIVFAGVLVSAAGSLTFQVAGVWLTVPGYMVFAAIAYASAATALMFVLGKPLVGLTERKNQAEAEFLFALTRARESAEGIALASGEPAVRRALADSLGRVVGEWLAIMGRQMRIAVVANANGVLLPIVPLLLLAPKYVAAEITLGQMMQLAAAFGFVVASLNWFFDNFQRFAEWTASVNRVAALDRALGALAPDGAAAQGRIEVVRAEGDAIRLDDVSATFLDGRVVVADADVVIAKGERVLLTGDTGAGKSTLVRAIAGLWPWGSGRVTLPKGAQVVVVPQHAFVPSGALREAVTWPMPPGAAADETIRAALTDVGLAQLTDRLDDAERWDQVLAEGERERLAFARVLLSRPDILILDEATGALDPDSAAALYTLLRQRFPALTLLSVGHREDLEALHDRVVRLVVEADGARTAAGPGERAARGAAPDAEAVRRLLRHLPGPW